MQAQRITTATKLTLSLSKSSIAFAKQYASLVGKSVSSLTEDYFNSLQNTQAKTIKPERTVFKPSPIVSEIAGIIPAELAGDFDYKQEYADYLEKKYGI